MKTIILYLSIIITFSSFSQSGKVTYNASIKNAKIIKETDDEETKAALEETVMNSRDVEFTLIFNNNESFFTKNEEMEDEEKGLNITALSAGEDEYYTSLPNKKILSKKDSYGEIFLINIAFPKWEYSEETKKIGNYICHKATTTRVHKSIFTKKTKIVPITAWYTNEIPVSFGPKNYVGLPGLIIQLTDSKLTFTAKSITIDPKKKIKIEKPKKGIKVTKKEYNKISTEKFKKRFGK